MNKTVLIVDDDSRIANLISVRLKKQGYEPECVFNGHDAVAWVTDNPAVLVMLDVRLPDVSGVEVLQEILKIRPDISVIMISAHADVKVAVECIKLGACDFLEKPFEFPTFDAKVKQIFKQVALQEEITSLKKELKTSYKDKSFIGGSMIMRKVFQSIEVASKSSVGVIIYGESGTGKELVARAIHSHGSSADQPFVAVNCGAIPENLIESELFGHEKGSFTSSVSRKIGKFEQAGSGTVFLDEIAELPLALQVKLLRVLQEKEVERVGGTESIPVRARVIAATNKDLKAMVEEGSFREDLFYRINVFPIEIPPLRDRREDIPELFIHFLSKHKRNNSRIKFKVDDQALECLKEYDWPGNVRELENFVERLTLLAGDKSTITAKDIDVSNDNRIPEKAESHQIRENSDKPINRTHAIQQTEKSILERALQEAGGNITKASKIAEMSRDTFYRKMKKYAISRD